MRNTLDLYFRNFIVVFSRTIPLLIAFLKQQRKHRNISKDTEAAIKAPHALETMETPIIPPKIRTTITNIVYTMHFVQYLNNSIKTIDRRKDRANIPNMTGQYLTSNYLITVRGRENVDNLLNSQLNPSFAVTK